MRKKSTEFELNKTQKSIESQKSIQIILMAYETYIVCCLPSLLLQNNLHHHNFAPQFQAQICICCLGLHALQLICLWCSLCFVNVFYFTSYSLVKSSCHCDFSGQPTEKLHLPNVRTILSTPSYFYFSLQYF